MQKYAEIRKFRLKIHLKNSIENYPEFIIIAGNEFMPDMDELIKKQIDIEILTDEETITGLISKVILYNDDWHTFDEVIVQLIKAVQCSFEKARDFAFEVHVRGKAIVYTGNMLDCLKVSSVLEEIALNTQIIT